MLRRTIPAAPSRSSNLLVVIAIIAVLIGLAPAGRPGRPRGRPPGPVRQQPEADRAGDAELSRRPGERSRTAPGTLSYSTWYHVDRSRTSKRRPSLANAYNFHGSSPCATPSASPIRAPENTTVSERPDQLDQSCPSDQNDAPLGPTAYGGGIVSMNYACNYGNTGTGLLAVHLGDDRNGLTDHRSWGAPFSWINSYPAGVASCTNPYTNQSFWGATRISQITDGTSNTMLRRRGHPGPGRDDLRDDATPTSGGIIQYGVVVGLHDPARRPIRRCRTT